MRDRDVRNAIQVAMMATGAFDGVWISGLPTNYGQAASQCKAAAIEPSTWTQQDLWDSEPSGGVLFTSEVKLTMLCRDSDPQTRDEAVEDLVQITANALNGQSLAGLTLPPFTKVKGGTWAEAIPPERRITVNFTYQYIVEGWAAEDTTP